MSTPAIRDKASTNIGTYDIIFKQMPLPKKISPSPLIEVITEFRFSLDIPVGVLLGKVYDPLVDILPKFQELPVMNLPAEIRERDPSFKYAPYYRFSNDKFLVNIGQGMISINCVCGSIEYPGWEVYKDMIKKAIGFFKNIEQIGNSERLGVRYINFLENDNKLIDIVKIDLKLASNQLKDSKEFNIGTVNTLGDNLVRVNLSSEAEATIKGVKKKGQLFDVDCYSNSSLLITEWFNKADELHTQAKETFFGLLEDKYIESLNPEY